MINMKRIWNILFTMTLLTLNSFASSRSDVKIIEATENIRYLGQKISKDYLYLYHNPKKIELKEVLEKDIDDLESSIYDIDMSTINTDSKNILDFLTYNKDEIKDLLTQSTDKERSILILDYSESFLEGANSIASSHIYAFSDEEKMLMLMKKLEYLLERVSKYYIASNLNLDKVNNFNHMEKAILKTLFFSLCQTGHPGIISKLSKNSMTGLKAENMIVMTLSQCINSVTAEDSGWNRRTQTIRKSALSSRSWRPIKTLFPTLISIRLLPNRKSSLSL